MKEKLENVFMICFVLPVAFLLWLGDWLRDNWVPVVLLALMGGFNAVGIWWAYWLDSLDGTFWFTPFAAACALSQLALLVKAATLEGWLRVTEVNLPRVGDVDILNNRVFDGSAWIDHTAESHQRLLSRPDRVRINRPSAIDWAGAAASQGWGGMSGQSFGLSEQFLRAQFNLDRQMDAMMRGQLFASPEWRVDSLWSSPQTNTDRPVVRRADDILNEQIKVGFARAESHQRRAEEERLHVATLQRWLSGDTSVAEIHQQENAELRQAMLEKFGLDRYMAEVGAKVIATDQYGELLEYADVRGDDVTELVGALGRSSGSMVTGLLGAIRLESDPFTGRVTRQRMIRQVRAVRVLNSTPDWPPGKRLKFPETSVARYVTDVAIAQVAEEICTHRDYVKTSEKTATCNGCGADGEYRTYILRVPPTMRTPQEAIAWTFGMQAEEYQPVRMT